MKRKEKRKKSTVIVGRVHIATDKSSDLLAQAIYNCQLHKDFFFLGLQISYWTQTHIKIVECYTPEQSKRPKKSHMMSKILQEQSYDAKPHKIVKLQ